MAAAEIPVPRPNAVGVSIVLPGQTPAGEHILGVLLKRSYDIVPNRPCRRAETDRALVPGDVFWDSPMNSSVRHESDFVPFKLGTDVVLNGLVYAPGGNAAQSCQAGLFIAGRSKEFLVIGDRVAKYNGATPAFTDPVPFETMELRYERAYGGTDVYSNPATIYPYPNNPLGRGFAVANTKASVENLPLPNFEDPADMLTAERLCIGEFANWKQQPFPAGLGWYPKNWMARAKYAGILPADRPTEQEMRQAYAKLLPADQRAAYLKHGIRDMDFSFFQGASRGLAMPYLSGGEEVWTENLSPEGRLHFWLPPDKPRIGLDIGSGLQEPPTVMHTVAMHMEERQIDIVWRCAVPYPGRDWLPQMQKMDVSIQ
jgi:hypothetical protein